MAKLATLATNGRTHKVIVQISVRQIADEFALKFLMFQHPKGASIKYVQSSMYAQKLT